MEAPKKIYVPTAGDELHYHMTCPKNEFIESVEYTRTDVIVERAVQFIKERLNFADNAWYIEGEITIKEKVIEDLKSYMKGE